jgi:hypothetical protein
MFIFRAKLKFNNSMFCFYLYGSFVINTIFPTGYAGENPESGFGGFFIPVIVHLSFI